MTTIVWIALIFISMAVTEACRDKPRADGYDFLHLMRLGILTPSKKQSGKAQQRHRSRG
jgi:hypothetical protein